MRSHDQSLHRLRTFKLGLLASLGVPLACGGEAVRSSEGSGGSSESAGSSSSRISSATTTSAVDSFTATTASTVTGSSGSSTSGGGVGGATSFECTNPESVELAGERTGFVLCEEGYEARIEPVTCPNLLPQKGSGGAAGAPSLGDCLDHSDCPGELEFCESNGEYSLCTAGCRSDEDCSSGHICHCHNPIGRCVPATCTKSSDCPGSVCAGTFYGDCIREQEQASDPEPPLSDALQHHGILGDFERAWLRAQILDEVVRPCARALLSKFGPQPAPSALV